MFVGVDAEVLKAHSRPSLFSPPGNQVFTLNYCPRVICATTLSTVLIADRPSETGSKPPVTCCPL